MVILSGEDPAEHSPHCGIMVRQQNCLLHSPKKLTLWPVAGVIPATGSGGSPLNSLPCGRADPTQPDLMPLLARRNSFIRIIRVKRINSPLARTVPAHL